MTLAIRPVQDADIPALAAIYAASVDTETASWEYRPPDDAEFARRRADIVAKGFPYLVAVEDGRVAGYAYASSFRAREGYRYVVEDSVYIDPAMKGRGIGKALLNALIDACAAKGYRQMVAVIGDSANAASIRLHEACGFVHAAHFRCIGWKFGRWLDSVQMQRALGEGSGTDPA